MSLSAEDFDRAMLATGKTAAPGPILEAAQWGYAIRDGAYASGLQAVLAAGGRFVGALLLFSAFGLWVMPDSLYGQEIVSMKLAAMVMFSVFGGYLFWIGSASGASEIHIDLRLNEVRAGKRGLRGGFRRSSRLGFEDVASVYLLRSKDHSQPARLFLRLAGVNTALEVACGPERVLEPLRARLVRDISRAAQAQAGTDLAREGLVAA